MRSRASTRYLVLRYNQLRAKLWASADPGYVRDVFTEADDRELRRVYDELVTQRASEIHFEGAIGWGDLPDASLVTP